MKLTEAQYEFLSILAKYTASVGRRDLPPADRQEDKVRQSCRRRGLAKFGKWEGDRVIGWKITPFGRAALAEKGKANER